MAEKPPEEGYISVVDEEPEILQLLKWDTPQIPKQQEPRCMEPPEKPKTPAKKKSKYQDINPFDLPDPEFIEAYRLSKDLVRSLCEELETVISDAAKQNDFTVESKVLATISFFATGKYQKLIMGKTDPSISQYLLGMAIVQVTEAMNHPTIVKKYIHFPHLQDEREMVKAKFYMKYGVPNVVGCVDCTHVPIAKPDGDEKSHFNKSFHSQKVQVICDSELTIISVDPSPGSQSHDGILSRHAVKVDLESLNGAGEQCWLIGGPYYSLKPYVMTPIPKITKKSPASPEKYYNTVHTQTHSSVLLTIKHLKSRWKWLQASCNKQFDPTTVSMMIVACCVLHNICNRRGMPIPALTAAEERLEVMKQKVANGPVSKKLNNDQNGNQVRAQLVERMWNERRIVPESNGPKKRAKKVEPPPPPVQQPMMQPQQQQQQQSHPPHTLQGHDDPSKRPRVAMNPPAYVMPHVTVWGHYPHHH